MQNSKVWVVKEQMMRNDAGSIPMDYGPAMQFGDLEFITTHDMPLYGGPHSSFQEQWNEDVHRFVEQYNPERDYVVTTGQPIAIFLVGWVLASRNKVPRFLVWRREENRYRVVNVDHKLTEWALQ